MTTRSGKLLAYVGTYTHKGTSKGIYVFSFDTATGALAPLSTTGGIDNPSFLAIHPSRKYLYAVSEMRDSRGRHDGAVAAFAIDGKTGALKALNSQPSQGVGPCHVAVDSTGSVAIVSNYQSGAVGVFPVKADGSLGEASQAIQHEGSGPHLPNQSGPHAHSATISPDNRYAYVCNLGTDKVMAYALDTKAAKLTLRHEIKTAPGAGPRHFDFHPNARFAYIINELNNTLTAYAYDAASGNLTELQTLPTLPPDFKGQNSTADVHVHPNGQFVYGSNRGHDSLAIYRVDTATGKLTLVGHQPTGGKTPRNFAISPDGAFLLAEHQDSDTIVHFRVDQKTGKLTPTGHVTTAGMPVCLKLMPFQG